MRRRYVWRLGQWLVGIVIVAAAATQVARQWDALRQQPLQWHIRPLYLLGAVLLTWTMYGVLIHAWRTVLHGWGARLDTITAARIWTVSSLGKYLPGKVWAIAGMALMAQRAGVPPWAATGAAVVLQALSLAAAAAIVGVTGMATLESRYPWFRPALLAITAASVIGIGLLLWRPFMERLVRVAGITADRSLSPRPRSIAVALLGNITAWVGYGCAFWLMARGVLPAVEFGLPLAIGAFTASYVAGFLALLAPGGLLVREGTMFLMLQGAIGPAAAGALALASRVMLTFTEFGAAAPFVIRPGESTRVVT